MKLQVRSLLRPTLSLAVWLGCCSLTFPAWATRDPAAAEALFRQGREALERKDYVTACAKFAESQRLDPAAGTLMNWASCEETRGHTASAWQHWREALDYLPAGDDRTEFAQARVAALEPKLPRLTLQLVAAAPPGTRVERDGVLLGAASLATPLPVDPGSHVVRVVAPGFAERRYEVTLKEAEQRVLVVAPGERLPEPPPTVAAQADSGPSGRRTLGWVLGGVGVVGIGAAVGTGLWLADRQDVVDAECDEGLCSQRGLDAASTGQTLLWANAASWVVGVAGLGTGAYFLLSSSGEEPAPRGAAFTIQPLAGGAALGYSRAF